MDSVNSGSLQSSSGGDEEYDSRAESISAFLNNPSSHVGPMPNPPQPPPPPEQQQQLPHHHHTQTSSMFDPLSNYFDHPSLSRSNPNSLLNLDTVWSKTLRSDPNCTDLGNIMASPPSNQPFSTSQGQARGNFGTSSPAMMQFPPAPENATRASASSASSDQTNIVRSNSKKRSRASRRAPTTVLTTDTTNFRAMVQEFTGIPAPPFTSSPFPRSRLDLFGTPSSMRSSHHFDSSTPPYLLRPFAQKLQPQPPPPFVSSSSSSSFPSSSMVDAAATASTTNITSGSSNHTSNSTSINYQLPSDFALLKQHPQNPLNLHNSPILTFQSLLQTPPRYNPLANSAILGSKPQGSLEIPSSDPHLKMGGLEEFGLSHGHVSTHLGGGLQNIVSSDGTASSRRDNHHPPSWGGDGAGSNNDGDQGLLRSLNGNYSHSQRVTNGKLHFSSASSSDFHGDKGSENVSTRSEGMVESWICSD